MTTTPTTAARRAAHRQWHERPLRTGATFLAGAIAISALGGWARRVRAADEVRPAAQAEVALEVNRKITSLSQQLEQKDGRIAAAQYTLDRANAIIHFSTRYQVPADLAAAIYDVAVSEGIDPALGFRLVKVESNFQQRALSGARAIGYTQVRLPTARFYEPDVTEARLYDRETNLRIGFRYLRDLLDRYGNDMQLALVAYNRGPGRVDEIMAAGGDPHNGYASAVLSGFRPTRRGASQAPVVQ